ncbi:MAG TPA: SufE family protein [Pirellulales bacterium]|nr:SufE family protein [Pirellulales bacterium]
MTTSLDERTERIAAEFSELEPRERLELLLEFAEKLPPLPERYRAERDAGLGRVPECQTPVFLWVRLEDGRVHMDADVAPESPTVKGFVSVLVEIFDGASCEEAIAFEPNFVRRFGLAEALGMVRMRGLEAIAHVIGRKVAAAANDT